MGAKLQRRYPLITNNELSQADFSTAAGMRRSDQMLKLYIVGG